MKSHTEVWGALSAAWYPALLMASHMISIHVVDFPNRNACFLQESECLLGKFKVTIRCTWPEGGQYTSPIVWRIGAH